MLVSAVALLAVCHRASYSEFDHKKKQVCHYTQKSALYIPRGNPGHIFPQVLLKKCASFDNKLGFPFDFTENFTTFAFHPHCSLRPLYLSVRETFSLSKNKWTPFLPLTKDNFYKNLAPAAVNALNIKHLPHIALHESCCNHKTFLVHYRWLAI